MTPSLLPTPQSPSPARPPAPSAADALAAAACEPAQQVLERLGSSFAGLSAGQAAERLARLGPNVVETATRLGLARRLLALLASPLSLLMLSLAAVSWATGEPGGALVIALIVLLSALLSFVQETRSGRAAERLRAMVGTRASVLRPTALQPVASQPAAPVEIPLEQLVPGDVLHLSAGDTIPADLRVLSARDLFVNQSALTGESLPVEKQARPAEPGTPLLELDDVCFMGTDVVSGTAVAVVVATGRDTCFGAIAASLAAERPPTAFERGIRRFIRLMLRFMLVMAPLVLLLNGTLKGDWLQALLFATAVAVGLTPELLPMIVTINLARGAIALSRRKVVVKRLEAIQNLGAMDVLCTDKTGTLTQDKVVLKRHVDLAGRDSARVLELAYLNSAFQSGLKNLLDVAVLEHAAELEARLGLGRRHEKIDEVPFDFERRRMSVIVGRDAGASHLLICKGAVEEVFDACTRVELDGEVSPVDADHRDALRRVARNLNAEGFRVIAVAYKELPPAQSVYGVADESDLVLAGYIAFLDPPKESAGPALAQLRRQGVAVKILTGDNDAVARNVCRQVGLAVGGVLLGADIARMSEAQLAEAAQAATLFAKLAPGQKARVVRALRSSGHVVGFMGDGINDGPALKAADVGISVDGAVDIAKESADIVLLEKSLLVLQEGVIEGRRVFGNIVKYLRMSASSSFGNVLSVVGASVFLPFLPMAPVQILLNNLLYDASQTTLAADRIDDESVSAPRHWDIADIGRFMLCLGPISSLFDYATFAVLLHGFGAWDRPALFHTGWFVESLLSQALVVHVIRTPRMPLVESRPSPALAAATLAVCAVGVLLPYSPAAPALGLVPLPGTYWVALTVILAGYLVSAQIAKTWLARRFGLA